MQEYGNIVREEEGKSPLHFFQQDVHCSSKRPRHILQYEGHGSEMEGAMMRGKSGFFMIFLSNLYLQISAIIVQSRKHRSVSQKIDAFGHAWYRVRILDLL